MSLCGKIAAWKFSAIIFSHILEPQTNTKDIGG